jgi:SAM-dependent methyltransferase
MLHHVPTERQQNAILAEILRVLRPGGTLIASDSLASVQLHEFHVDDTYNPIEPSGLLPRLRTIGFDEVTVSVGKGLLFWASKTPADEP